MDLLNLKREELLRFFHSKKTEMSCMENPQIFLSQLRDHDLIPEDRYQEVSRLKSKGDIKKALYDILDQFEREKPEQIHVFWRSVFQEIILNQYPTLRVLQKNFTQGEKCILYQQWFTPPEFETFSRKMSPNNWKWSIQCQDTTLGKLMEAEKPLFQSHQASTEEETEKRTEQQQEEDHGNYEEEETELQHEGDHDNFMNEGFVEEPSPQRDVSLKKQIKPLSVLRETSEKKRKEPTEDEEENPGRKRRSRRLCNNEKEKPGPSSQLIPEEEDETDSDCIICDDIVKEASCNTRVFMTKDVSQKGKPLTETDKKKHKEHPGDEEKNPRKKKRNRDMYNNDDKLQLSQFTPAYLKKAKTNKVLASAISKSQLPVTCEGLEGTLYKDRMAKGEKCILFQNRWFTPREFRMRAGNKRSQNWKLSIRYYGVHIGKLIKEGYLVEGLQSTTYREDCKKAKRSMLPTDQTNTDEEETEEQTEQQLEDNNDRSKMVFKVTCGAVTGTLHKKRFASGTCAKSIRTETKWMSPVEFVKKASGQTDASWKRDIKWEGKPLSVLIEENILRVHYLLCDCELCQPEQEDLENQNNDDECCVCKTEGPELVVCDHCPHSFHQKCHLPHVEDNILGDDKPWMCTFCIFQTTQMWRHSDDLEMEAAMSHQISRHMLECQYLLMYLCSADEEQTFASNPNLFLKNYSTAVQTPMWFGKVADRLLKKEYHTVGEFVSDVHLIFTNCATYNREDAEFFARGSRLKKLFIREFKKVFNISD